MRIQFGTHLGFVEIPGIEGIQHKTVFVAASNDKRILRLRREGFADF